MTHLPSTVWSAPHSLPAGLFLSGFRCHSGGVDTKDLEAEVSLLLDQMEGEQGDRHEIYLRVRQLLSNLEAVGMPAPDDLVRLARELEESFREEG